MIGLWPKSRPVGIYSSAITIALVIMAAALGFALLPNILERLPRRRKRREEHLLRPNQEEASPRRSRPDLKREAPRDTGEPPASGSG